MTHGRLPAIAAQRAQPATKPTPSGGQLNNSNGDEIKSVTIKPGPGPAGYDTWQITGESGSAASRTRDQAHAVGGQLGLTYLPWFLSVNLHGFYEYFAEARFQGGSFGVSIAKKF